jgi:D-alanyl-D-alanine carboxypeptidase/D-alanyl-D-alanine-endopeptidase (penicillin-binding protein 4)
MPQALHVRAPSRVPLPLASRLRTLLCATCLVGFAEGARAQDQAVGTSALAHRLAGLIDDAQLGSNIGVAVADASTGQRIYSLDAETPRNPASNMKLVTAATALVELGPEFRLRTTMSGAIGEDGGVDSLVLRGEGDPSLTYGDLLSMVRRLVELGVRRVENVVVDGSYFDEQALPPAFEQQPHEVAAFRAAVGAVSVDRNAYELRVAPGPAGDAPASIILRCPDYFALEANVNTTASGGPQIVAEQKPRGEQLALKVSGSVPLGIRGVGYERRIDAPLPYAGNCLRAALRSQRIVGALRVRTQNPPAGLPALVTHESEPVGNLLGPVGKNSDNYYAEMLLKVVGAHASHRPGSSQAGTERAQLLLAQAGVPKGAATLVNGSGLFKGGAIAPDHLVSLLVAMHRDPALRPEYLSQLAVAGKDGTLRTRFGDLKPARTVRAKTGTLDDVIALSGYVLGPADHSVAFSFLFNGIAGKQGAARALADNMAKAIAEELYKQPPP